MSIKKNPFSLRLGDSDKAWVRQQAEHVAISMTEVVKLVFSAFRFSGIPQKVVTLNGELSGDIWEGTFTGNVYVQILESNVPIRGLLVAVEEKTLIEFKGLLDQMIVHE